LARFYLKLSVGVALTLLVCKHGPYSDGNPDFLNFLVLGHPSSDHGKLRLQVFQICHN